VHAWISASASSSLRFPSRVIRRRHVSLRADPPAPNENRFDACKTCCPALPCRPCPLEINLISASLQHQSINQSINQSIDHIIGSALFLFLSVLPEHTRPRPRSSFPRSIRFLRSDCSSGGSGACAREIPRVPSWRKATCQAGQPSGLSRLILVLSRSFIQAGVLRSDH
jgi:hypothetical protein